MKIPISTIRVIIMSFQSTENVTKRPGRGHVSICLVRRRVWVAKDSPRTTAEELQKIVESRGQKTFKKMIKQHLITTCCLGGYFKKKYPTSYKNKLQHIQLSDTTGTSNGTGFYGQTKHELFSSKHSRWVQWNILLYFLSCGPIFQLEVLDILFRHMA